MGSKELSEKDAKDNKELAVESFDSIKKAKSLVASKFPSSCNLCICTCNCRQRFCRFLAGGPYYRVKKVRWDGKISMASIVHSNFPRANSIVDELVHLFKSKCLTLKDLVVLLGADTIGFAHYQNIFLIAYTTTKALSNPIQTLTRDS
ncbi:peroxidase 19, partial [Olea europaea subsp. europaea]